MANPVLYKFRLEYGGGLGDVLLQMYEGNTYNALMDLQEGERALVRTICHNPSVSEFFSNHPKKHLIDVEHFEYWHPNNDEQKRTEHGIRPIYTNSFGPPTPLQLFPTSEDKKILSAISGSYYVLAASAGDPIRSIPLSLLHLLADYCEHHNIRLIATGKSYERLGRVELNLAELGIESLIDKLTPAGVYHLVHKSSGLVCCHSFTNIAGWLARRPTLLLYPEVVHTNHLSKKDAWSFGIDYPETQHCLFGDVTQTTFEKFFRAGRPPANSAQRHCIFTICIEPKEAERWDAITTKNIADGRAWYHGIPDSWWWGMSREQFVQGVAANYEKKRLKVKVCLDSLRQYATRIGADFVCKSKKSFMHTVTPHVEKQYAQTLLKEYDRILFADYDVLVKATAPDIFDVHSDTSKFYLLDETPYIQTREARPVQDVMKKFSIKSWPGSLNGIHSYFNTGVMLFSKEQKAVFDAFNLADYFEHIYEQTYLNTLIVRNSIVEEIGFAFNGMPIFQHAVDFDIRQRSHFIHYAGGGGYDEIERDYARFCQPVYLTSPAPAEVITRHDFGGFLHHLQLFGEGVEVGVAEGEFSLSMLQQWRCSRYYLVDAWRHFPQGYDDFNNVSDEEHQSRYLSVLAKVKHEPRATVVRALSEEAVHLFADGSLDWVYLDSNHSFEAACQDLEAWFPKVRNGGVFAGHDYLDGHIPSLGEFRVKSAVDAFATKHNAKLRVTTEAFPSWYFIKGGVP